MTVLIRFRVRLLPEIRSARALSLEERKLLGTLLFGQFWRAARPWGRLERLLSSLTGLFHLLADGSFAHAKGLGDVGLLPAVLLQLKGPKAAGFMPIGGSRIHG